MNRFITLFLSFLLLISPLGAAEVMEKGAKPGQWTMDYDAALAMAKEKGLPILINFTGSDWCSWCILMEDKVFTQPKWQSFANEKIAMVFIDFPQNSSLVPAEYVNRNRQLQSEYEVQGFPTFIVLDSDGETVLGQLGASRDVSPESFINEVEGLIRFSEGEIQRKVAALGQERGSQYRALINQFKTAQGELMSWLSTRPQRTPENEARFQGFVDQLKSLDEQLKQF